MKSTAVLLVNLGTPDTYSARDVRRFLSEFLRDYRVMDMPAILRFIILQFFILPFRPSKVAKYYKEIWKDESSPLLYHTKSICEQLQINLGKDYFIEIGMRYGNPSIPCVLDKIRQRNPERIIVFPLFPQYASATIGTIHEKIFNEIKNWNIIPELSFISGFYNHPTYINSYISQIKKYINNETYHHFVFSYHGLPVSHIKKADTSGVCLKSSGCCSQINSLNHYCYRAQCYETTRLIANGLNIPENKYTLTFQSRLGKSVWLEPYTNEFIKNLPLKGNKKIMVICPSFVTDCIETIYEIGKEYKELFMANGGEKMILVESLNNTPEWISGIKEIVNKYCLQ